MNILFLIEQDFEPNSGGVQIVTQRLIEISFSYGHNIVLVSLNWSTDSKIELTAGENKFFNYYKISRPNSVRNLNLIFTEYDVDVCINQVGYDLYTTRKLIKAKIKKLRIINCLHINPLNFYNNHKFTFSNIFRSKGLGILDNAFVHKMILIYHILKQRYQLGFIIKNIDAFVMLSEKFREELYQLVPAVKKYDAKIFGIGNPFQVPDLDVSKLSKKNVILHVGRLEIEQKRVDLLLEIWHKLHSKLGNWEFWVVGHGSKEDYMKEYCVKNSLNRVKFFGKQNPNEFYKQAKIFHLTSAYEGFGNVLVEAQSFGCVPVLFDSYSAASDIVNHNLDGILVKPFDIDEYVNQTMQLIEEKDLLDLFKENARENSFTFSYDKTYEKWAKVFNSFLSCYLQF